VSHNRLLHNLKRRRVGGRWVNWVASFLSDRSAIRKLPQYNTESFKIATGIPQGSPLSPTLYLFYNADLLEETSQSLTPPTRSPQLAGLTTLPS
jgi:hypothetical protein